VPHGKWVNAGSPLSWQREQRWGPSINLERRTRVKFRKKPVVVDVILYDGGNYSEVVKFMSDYLKPCQRVGGVLEIATLEGTMEANVGDVIIRGVKGEYYPCKPDIFNMSYEKVED
jgi:hypothetical protein